MPDTILSTLIIIGTGIILRALQDLCINKSLFEKNIFDWRYCLSVHEKWKPARSGLVVDAILSCTAFRIMSVLNILTVLIAIWLAYAHPEHTVWSIVALLGFYYHVRYRLPYAQDGSDHATCVVLLCLFIMTLDNEAEEYLRLGTAAAAFHTALSYYTSGIVKMTSPIWRSGEGLIGVMNTAVFGHDFMARLITARPALSQALSWMMMCGHVFTGTMILIGGPFVYAAIMVSLLFHVAIAVFMRLNSFVWPFAATYPSLIYIADWDVRYQLLNDILAMGH